MDRDLKEITASSPDHRGRGSALMQAVNEASNPVVVLNRIVAQALVLIPAADGATVELADSDELVYISCAGSLADHAGVRLGLEGSFSGLAVTSNRILCCDDTETDPRVNLEACRKVGAVSMICVPLQRPSGAIGVLKVTSRRARAFSERDIAVLERLAPFITTSIAAASDLSKVIPEMLDVALSQEVRDPPIALGGRYFDTQEADAVTQFVANVVSPGILEDIDARQVIEAVLRTNALTVHLQPIYHLGSGELFGAEALARFQGPPVRPPDRWFAEAHRIGLGIELELLAVRAALDLLSDVPSHVHLALNVGPAVVANPRLGDLLEGVEGSQVVLELTEHVEIDDYPTLRGALNEFRRDGFKIATDDTGAGVSGLTHILQLAPDYIKLDRELTHGIDFDPVRRSLASALVVFASESGAEVIAEGIETADALHVLTDLGITYGQGFHLGRPGNVGQLAHAPSPHYSPLRGLIGTKA